MNKYKEQWDNYYEGKIAMWSYFGYQYHSYLIAKHILPKLIIPEKGKIIQIGTALGTTIEKLCDIFGQERVIGYDLFNPLSHPNIFFLDTESSFPPENKIAYIDIDVGSMSHSETNRKTLLEWAISNMLKNGYILTNRKLIDKISEVNFTILPLNSFNIPELWKNPHESRINTKVLLKIGDE